MHFLLILFGQYNMQYLDMLNRKWKSLSTMKLKMLYKKKQTKCGSSLESCHKRNNFFLETSHGDHRHVKQITDAFTVSQIEEVIFLTWRRTQSHQWTKDYNKGHNIQFSAILYWAIHIFQMHIRHT
jgi:hypothetical protein